MYIPDLYKNEDKQSILSFIEKNSFAILISQIEGKPWATHIPVDYEINSDGVEILYGHLSANNLQADSFLENKNALVIFSGNNHYISSSWYNHENVPTWNYEAVHVYGSIKIISDEKEIIEILKKQTNKYERISKCPIHLENLSKETMQQAKDVKAFEIEINKIEAINKMSQNRDEENYGNIISELKKTGEISAIALAEQMEKLKN